MFILRLNPLRIITQINEGVKEMNTADIEKEKIMKTLEYFFEGVDKIDAEITGKAFHPGTSFFTRTPEGIKEVQISDYYSFYPGIRNNPDHPWNRKKADKKILFIDIEADIAAVKAEWTFDSFKNIEYYNLVNDGNQWYIVSKVWYTSSL
jgi:hypothetical protein